MAPGSAGTLHRSLGATEGALPSFHPQRKGGRLFTPPRPPRLQRGWHRTGLSHTVRAHRTGACLLFLMWGPLSRSPQPQLPQLGWEAVLP